MERVKIDWKKTKKESVVIEMFCISVVVVVTQLFTLAQTYQTVKLNVRILYYVNYISVD